MDNQNEIESIARQLKQIVDANVSDRLYNIEELSYKNHYESVMSELESQLEAANETIEDYKEGGLTINAVEMEGFRRGLTTMINEFRNWEKYIRQDRLDQLGIE